MNHGGEIQNRISGKNAIKNLNGRPWIITRLGHCKKKINGTNRVVLFLVEGGRTSEAGALFGWDKKGGDRWHWSINWYFMVCPEQGGRAWMGGGGPHGKKGFGSGGSAFWSLAREDKQWKDQNQDVGYPNNKSKEKTNMGRRGGTGRGKKELFNGLGGGGETENIEARLHGFRQKIPAPRQFLRCKREQRGTGGKNGIQKGGKKRPWVFKLGKLEI